MQKGLKSIFRDNYFAMPNIARTMKNKIPKPTAVHIPPNKAVSNKIMTSIQNMIIL